MGLEIRYVTNCVVPLVFIKVLRHFFLSASTSELKIFENHPGDVIILVKRADAQDLQFAE